jgi:nitrogen fixation NifU-like protein
MSDELRELYQEVILDHGRNPRNFRHPPAATCEAKGFNPLCGDELTVYLEVDDKGQVRDAAFEGRGCAISVASASLMTELVRGKSEAEAHALFEDFHHLVAGEDDAPPPHGSSDKPGLSDEMERLQVLSGVRNYPVRVKCATLAWHTMNAAFSGEQKVTTE